MWSYVVIWVPPPPPPRGAPYPHITSPHRPALRPHPLPLPKRQYMNTSRYNIIMFRVMFHVLCCSRAYMLVYIGTLRTHRKQTDKQLKWLPCCARLMTFFVLIEQNNHRHLLPCWIYEYSYNCIFIGHNVAFSWKHVLLFITLINLYSAHTQFHSSRPSSRTKNWSLRKWAELILLCSEHAKRMQPLYPGIGACTPSSRTASWEWCISIPRVASWELVYSSLATDSGYLCIHSPRIASWEFVLSIPSRWIMGRVYAIN